MAEASTRKVSRVKKDIISELPGNIHEYILGCLPIQDAVRTSVLSTRWRHTWTMTPHLIFDNQFLCRMMVKIKLEPSETSNLAKVLCSLHNIEIIYIAAEFIQFLAGGGSLRNLSKPLHNLKTLNISGINFVDSDIISCLLCLIRSAPNLCKLNISADIYTEFSVYGDLRKDYRVGDLDDFTIDQLKIVTLSYFEGRRAELELVKYLLAHAPLLKTMSIHRHAIVTKDVSLLIAEEMLQYTRASSRAQIRYLEQPVVINVFEGFECFYT
ncbi:F-box/FBD/LRR-repeat protein At1g13570-like isoform X3 [Apium graveolens]|uniref:F-box/FBD/LRR-repeat protein At1g13570-like isoform X3 n=1 Tax=Apium graveolens TaxID=4045 RepID=UPI003D7A3C66